MNAILRNHYRRKVEAAEAKVERERERGDENRYLAADLHLRLMRECFAYYSRG